MDSLQLGPLRMGRDWGDIPFEGSSEGTEHDNWLFNWLLNWALGFTTPYLVNKGPGDAGLGSKIWFLWASFCYLGAVFVAFSIYETKGKCSI